MTMPHLTRPNMFCYFLERENSKKFSLYAFTAEQGWIWQKLENVVQNFLSVISDGPGFKFFTLNQVIDEVKC